jgi:hypothetical protein
MATLRSVIFLNSESVLVLKIKSVPTYCFKEINVCTEKWRTCMFVMGVKMATVKRPGAAGGNS